jgi:hypothetical protein
MKLKLLMFISFVIAFSLIINIGHSKNLEFTSIDCYHFDDKSDITNVTKKSTFYTFQNAIFDCILSIKKITESNVSNCNISYNGDGIEESNLINSSAMSDINEVWFVSFPYTFYGFSHAGLLVGNFTISCNDEIEDSEEVKFFFEPQIKEDSDKTMWGILITFIIATMGWLGILISKLFDLNELNNLRMRYKLILILVLIAVLIFIYYLMHSYLL